MNYLQIWMGKKPTKKLLKSMKSVIDKVDFSKETYTIIADTNFLQDDRLNYINTKDYLSLCSADSLIIKDFIPKIDKKNYYGFSDLIRFHYLSKNKDTVYLDCDVTLLKKFEFTNDKIYLPKINKAFDYFILYGKQEYFKEILDLSINDTVFKVMHSWIFRNINSKRYINSYEEITLDFFNHNNE